MLPARFHLPGLRYNYPLNMFWVSLLEEHPEFFREGVEIGSFFGVFPTALWNGGRLTPAYDQCDATFVKNVISHVNEKGIPVRYTFTNPLLNEHDCEDPYCNFLMESANNGMNEVIVFSPILEKYLREKYPNFAYNSSTCKEIRDVDELNKEMEQPYKYVVLDFNFNNKWDILDKIERKDKLEVLVNALCEPGCKRRGEHYRQIGKDQKTILLNRTLPADKQITIKHWHCDYGEFNCVHTIQDYPTFISPQDIWEKYIPAGINNFKIEGRTGNIFSLIDTYCFFMLKPECVGEARLLLIRNLQKAHVINVTQPRPGQWP